MHPSEVPSVEVDALPPDTVPAGTLLLDVREDDEWVAGHIAGAVHAPMSRLPQQLHDQPDLLGVDDTIVVVCKVGSRSAHVTAWLRQQGYDAANLAGGMLAWAAARRPMQSSDGRPPHVA
jgi:rhodanese-related sulfurtransferase